MLFISLKEGFTTAEYLTTFYQKIPFRDMCAAHSTRRDERSKGMCIFAKPTIYSFLVERKQFKFFSISS